MALSAALRMELTRRASLALYMVHRRTLKDHPRADEPTHVRYLTQLGSKLLYRLWAHPLKSAGIDIRITGVFCHQTPKAHFNYMGKTRKPELGDLLIVHEHLSPHPFRRALLLQAKKGKAGIPLGPIDPVQHHLYSTWPDFTLHGRGGPGTKHSFLDGRRHFRPKGSGTAYAMVEQSVPALSGSHHLFPTAWHITPPRIVGRGPGVDAAIVLVDMIAGQRGVARSSLPMTSSQMVHPKKSGHIAPNWPRHVHWAATVQELLDLTANKNLPARSSGPVSPLRGVSVGFAQKGGKLHAQGGTGGIFRRDGDGEANSPRSGFSLLHIETVGEAIIR